MFVVTEYAALSIKYKKNVELPSFHYQTYSSKTHQAGYMYSKIVMRQSAFTVYYSNYSFLFNCMEVAQVLDTMRTLTYRKCSS